MLQVGQGYVGVVCVSRLISLVGSMIRMLINRLKVRWSFFGGSVG